MKNIFKKIFFSVLVTCLFISCSDFSNSDSSFVTNEKGRIIISTNLDSQSRSVLPTGITEQTQGLTWELVGTCEEKTYSERWNDTTSEDGSVTSTAYNNMKNDNDLLLDVGIWLFSLKVKNNNGYVLVGTTQVAINSGENTLSFVMNEATSDDLSDGETVASGSIEFTLNFPKDVVDKVVAKLFKYENNNTEISNQTLSIDSSSTDNCSFVKYSYPDATGTTSSPLSAGYYILKIQLQQSVNNQNMPINTYSCLIRVAPGLLSQGKYTLPDLAQLYTINYKLEGGYFTDSSTTTSYNAYTSFELPEPTLDGHYFAGWYTQEYADDGILIDEKFFGNAGDTKTISEDITLYAKWNKEVTGITHANNTLYISDYEGLCIFRDIVNGSHTDAITIPANESISGASAFVCDVGTSYYYLSVELENDIDVTDTWIPIGVYSSTPSESRDYNATFDGNNHTITLSNGIDSTSYAALFVNVKGTIKNLVVEGNIKSEGSNAVAGICAYSNGGTFEHCVNKCIINSNTSSSTGGIVGYSNGATIKSCVNMGEISSSLSTIGGIVGAAYPSSDITIENSINLGKIIGTSNVSGIFGSGGSSVSVQKITDCINIGEIAVTPSDGDSWTYAAGIICSSDSVTVSNCISAGNIINNTSAFVGTAFFGAINYSSANGTYSNCYYDSSKIINPNDSNASEINSKTTSDLCSPDSNILSNWSKAASRYPLPNIVATDNLEGISELVWSEICELAKVDTSSSGSSGTATGITFAGYDSSYTTGSPKFYITTAEGLATFRNMVNGTVEGSITILKDGSSTSTSDYIVTSETVLSPIYGELISDIELPSDENWIPIGSSENPFLGYFSGNNHTVSNLNINATTDNQGLFGVVEGTANNVWCIITNLVVEGNITSSACNVAGIAGKATLTKFENCVNKATVESISTASNVAVAGIAGYVTNVEMKYCYNAGSITASSGVAGIAGYETESDNFYEYAYCINSGTITGGTNYSSIIGIANSSLSVYVCANYGKIISTIDNETGCIIGTCMTTGSAKTYVYDILSVGTIKTQGTYHVITKTADIETSYYDNSVLSSEDVTGLFGFETSNFIDDDPPMDFSEAWYYTPGVYPIPYIEESVSEEIWNEIVAAATPKNSGSSEPLEGTEVTSFDALKNAINGDDEVIIITSDITITEPLVINKKITICTSDSNYQLARATEGTVEGPMFEVTSNGELTLQNIIITGGYDNGYNAAVNNPFIYNNGKTVIENSTLKNNYLYYTSAYTNNESKSIHFYGGGAIFSNGDLTINNSSMENFYISTSTPYGGTIYIESGTCNIDGLTISSCSTNKNGAALYISENASSSTVNINNSKIVSNIASTNGGGIYAAAGTININNSEINSNSAQTGKSVYFKKNVIYSINGNTSVTVSTTGGYNEDITPSTSSISIN